MWGKGNSAGRVSNWKYWWWWLLLYSAIFHSQADSLRSHVILHEWLAYFIVHFLISIEVVYLQRWHGWCHMNLLPSRRILCPPYNHAPCHFMQSHICKVYACLAVTCHQHFWQDDRDLLRATAVTRGWNGYWNRSQHRKLTLEKNFFCRSRRDSNPRPFNHESSALTIELSPPWCGFKPQCSMGIFSHGQLPVQTLVLVMSNNKMENEVDAVTANAGFDLCFKTNGTM